MIIKNPRGVKNPSAETVKRHTFKCLNCKVVFISLNSLVDKYCTRKCASERRKNLGWKPSEESRRKISESNKGRVVSEETRKKLRKEIDEQKLTVLYLEEGKTQKECAEIFGCGPSTISRYLKQYDLVGKKSNHQAQIVGSSNTGQYMDKDWLYKKYFIDKSTAEEIADICGAGRTTVKRWIKKHGFKARSNSEGQIESIIQGRDKGLRIRSGWCRTDRYQVIRHLDKKCIEVEGTWELETVLFFEKNNIQYLVHGEFDPIVYWDVEGISEHRYLPDFYLPNENKYIEIKGRYNKEAKIKMGLVLSQNDINLELWFMKDLVSRGILNKNHRRKFKEEFYEQYLIKQKD